VSQTRSALTQSFFFYKTTSREPTCRFIYEFILCLFLRKREITVLLQYRPDAVVCALPN